MNETSDASTLTTMTCLNNCFGLAVFFFSVHYVSADHVFAIPETYPGYSSDYVPRVLITTSSHIPVQTVLTIPGLWFKVTTNITLLKPADIRLPVAARIAHPGLSNSTILVRSSSDEVTVHGFDNEYYGGGGFLVQPSNYLGMDHYIATYLPYSSSYPSFFTVSSAHDNETDVKISTKVGQVYNVTLQPYESYRFEGDNLEDLTGTRVQSNRPVSVTSGAFTRVPEGVSSYEGMLANIPPLDRWGSHFVLAPFLTKTCGYPYRVISSDQATMVTISHVGKVAIDKNGGFYEGDVKDDAMISITSDFPVMVVQYLKGFYACDTRGDPSMLVVQSTDDFYSYVTFPVFNTSYTNDIKVHVINVVTNCSQKDGLVLDESTSMSSWSQLSTPEDHEPMCAIRGEVTTGVHSVVNVNPAATFAVSVYMLCIGCTTSYAYQAGLGYTAPTEVPPIDLSPVTSIPGLDLQCEGTNMSAIFNTTLLPFEHASDVHLWDQNCTASAYGDNQAFISINYHECETLMEESGDHIIFRNALILISNDPSSPIKPPQVEIECRVERRHMVETSFQSSLKKHVSFGNFSFDLEIFHDGTYIAPYEPEEYPVDVKFGDDLYLAASVTTVNELEILVESCWGTPSANPWDEISYSVIANGCPVDESVRFIESGEARVQRFSLAAFAFKGDNWLVFLHCSVIVCDPSSPNSNKCSAECDGHIDSRVRRSNPDKHTISSGPMVVRG